MNAGILIPIIALLIPIFAIVSRMVIRGFEMREKEIAALGTETAEKAAQYAARTAELEQRVRVLEQIVTDGGYQTAAQIEALREPRLAQGDKIQ